MPSTIVKELFEKCPRPKKSDWVKLIEERQRRIVSQIATFSLETIGTVRCLDSGQQMTHGLNHDYPEDKEPNEITVGTQGVFTCNYLGEIGGFHIKTLWGLSRGGRWVIAEIRYHCESRAKDRTYEQAKEVIFKAVELPELMRKLSLCGVHGREIWMFTGKVMKEWEEKRRALHEVSLSMRNEVEEGERLLALIEHNPASR